MAPAPGVRHVIRDAKAYLCGHLHTLAGIAPEMFTSHPEGFFELELGDWKDNRRFRILAVDQVSFESNCIKNGSMSDTIV